MESFHDRSSVSFCCICENRLTNPCKLPCSHEICLNCVQNMVASEGRRNGLLCPMCRRVFTVPTVPPGSLEQPTYVEEKYRSTIYKSPGFKPLEHGSKVTGMAIMKDKLYVVCKNPPDVIFQYDDISTEKTFSNPPNTLKIKDMKWPRGMAGNDSLQCLYVTDWSEMFGGKLWKYDVKNRDVPPRVAAILDVQPFGVSYSSRNDTILVTCATPINMLKKRGWIYIYQEVRENLDKLLSLELDNLEIPRHAVLTLADKYLVCHGWTKGQHGVTAFHQNEAREIAVKGFYGSNRGGGNGPLEMNRPLSMTVDEDGLILVVDYYNHRIQLLTGDLLLLRHLITKDDHEIEYPRHVCLHPTTGRLFVGLEDGKVLAFDARCQVLTAYN